MKHRTFGFVFALIMLGIAGAAAGVALYTNYSASASEAGLKEALSILPVDCQFVFGIDVQKIVASPAYERFRQQQSQKTRNEMAEFLEKTGMDPARDIFYVLAAGRSISLPDSGLSVEKTAGKGVVIVIGKFNQAAIIDFIRSKTTPVEMQYESRQILLVPEPGKGTPEKGIVFLNDQAVALGDVESLQAVVSVREKGNDSVLLNPTMARLIDSVGLGEMIWFAGDTSSVLAKAPATTPLGQNIAAIRDIVGSFSITEAVTGRITATAIDVDSAVKIADVGRGFVAFAQLAGDKNPDLKTLLSGLQVSQNEAQVSVALNFSLDLLDKLGGLRRQPPTTGN